MRIYGYTTHGGPEVMGFLDVDKPSPGPGEVLIKNTATSANPGDFNTRGGKNQMPVKFPMAMGREAAGIVEACGAGVEHVRPGEEVFGSSASGHGSFGEFSLLDARSTTPIPEGLDHEEAACIPVAYATAFDILSEWDLAAGDTVVVVGAGGGAGTALVPMAAGWGLKVVGVASQSKEDIVTSLGAVHVESGAGWVDRVRTVVDKPAVVLDLVGGQTLDEAAELAPTVTSIAEPGRAGSSGVTRRRTREVYGQVADLIVAGRAKVTIGARHRFDDAAAAYAQLEDGHALGKIVVHF